MNSFEILQAMNEIPNSHIMSAGKLLGYDRKEPPVRKHAPKRIWLIAALVALLLLLMGCAVVYMLHLEDLQVGTHQFYVPTVYDQEGNVIPPETRAPIMQISLQGANMEALEEWLAFTNTYDSDMSIAIEADKTGSSLSLPENYHYIYGCYSQEMVDKLDEIVEKYDLKLLTEYYTCQHYESEVLLGALGLDGIVTVPDAEYGGGYFYQEGSFDLSVDFPMKTDDGRDGRIMTTCRYSLKEYFDAVHGSISESLQYTQWNYARRDGQNVLLILGEGIARIYADLPDAFVSIHVEPYILTDSEMLPLAKEDMEQLAEWFDFSIQPREADIVKAEQLRAEAQAKQDAKFDALIADYETACTAGYDAFVRYRLENSVMPEIMLYMLYDVNGDGVEELIIEGSEILSIKDGKSYLYFSLAQTDIAIPYFRPCKNDVFEVYSEHLSNHYYYFYQGDHSSAFFLTGLIHDTNKDIWYLGDDNEYRSRTQITAENAQKIRDSYEPVDADWLPLKKYGMDVASIHYKDPYAKYLASKLERFDNAVNYEYTLLDINDDGIKELISRDVEVSHRGEEYLLLSIHSIKDGKLRDMNTDFSLFSYLCEDGVLEYTTDFADDDYHKFYRCTTDGLEVIEEISRSPTTGYWSRHRDGWEVEYLTKEEVQAILSAYPRLELDMKPITEYPFK